MKKAFDQTVRDLKRGVNKKVLKVPSIEQKVLDATSNEPWGPHGTLLADIAQATRNYHEYQMIMSVLWKRINDTGKNWRHVYKSLTVLEYLVAHGSERVIDDIREHAYQISTLSDFQYIDSSGRDQGNNVRKKSQSLVVLVNDKERIQEVRLKAASNKEKYRTTPVGGMYRPGSGGYDDDRYGNRDDERNGYGREREWGSREDDRYGRDGDRYGRDEERSYRDGYRDDDYRGRGQNNDDYNYGSRSRSADRERNSTNEDDGQYSSRGSGAKADEQSQDGSTTGNRLESRYSGQSPGAPPSYEDAVGAPRSPPYNERDEESSQAYAPKAFSPKNASPSHTTAAAPNPVSASPPASVQTTVPPSNQEVDGFDEFDPRGPFSAAPATSNGITPATSAVEMDLLGSLSEPFSSNQLALVTSSQSDVTSEANPPANFNSGPTVVGASPPPTINSQPFDDPFGDGPFKAITSQDGAPTEQHFNTSTNSFTATSQSLDVPQPAPQNAATEVGGTFYDPTNMPSGSGPFGMPPTTSTPFPQHESSTSNPDIDILADILPPSGPPSFVNAQTGYQPNQSVSHSGFPPQTYQPALQSGQNAPQNGFQAQTGQHAGFPTQHGQPSLQPNYPQPADSVSQAGFPPQTMALALIPQDGQAPQSGFHPQAGQAPQSGFHPQPGQAPQSGFHPQAGQAPQSGFHPQAGQAPQSGFHPQAGQAPQSGFHPQSGSMQPNQPNSNFYGGYQPQPSTAPAGGYMAPPSSTGLSTHQNFHPHSGFSAPIASHMGSQAPQVQSSSLVAPASVTQVSTGYAVAPKPSSDKFETKSTVWADTLSRGLVNLNISGSKTNPLADIGVDFDAINRKDKRMEKQPATSTVTSTITMGKAMGSGSGVGRAGATSLRPQPNPMMGSGMNIGMAGGPGGGMNMGMGMGGYGGSQPMGRGMGMGMGPGMSMPGAGINIPGTMGMNMGMGPGMNMGMGPGMNMGMGPGMNTQQPMGPPGSTVPGGYNPSMGTGNYGQQPYGGYR